MDTENDGPSKRYSPFKIIMPYLEYIRAKFQLCSLVFL